MARWATLVDIAGVDYTGCRAEIIDGQAFLSPMVGSVDWANDMTPHVQLINRGVKGIQFGINMLSVESSKITSTVNNIKTAQSTNTTVRVRITDGLYTIDVNAVPDYSQQEWLTHGPHSEGWYQNVVWRFVSKGQYA